MTNSTRIKCDFHQQKIGNDNIVKTESESISKLIWHGHIESFIFTTNVFWSCPFQTTILDHVLTKDTGRKDVWIKKWAVLNHRCRPNTVVKETEADKRSDKYKSKQGPNSK